MMPDETLVKILIDDAVMKAIKHYGIEGAMQVIEEVYTCMPEVRNAMLANIKQRLKND